MIFFVYAVKLCSTLMVTLGSKLLFNIIHVLFTLNWCKLVSRLLSDIKIAQYLWSLATSQHVTTFAVKKVMSMAFVTNQASLSTQNHIFLS